MARDGRTLARLRRAATDLNGTCMETYTRAAAKLRHRPDCDWNPAGARSET